MRRCEPAELRRWRGARADRRARSRRPWPRAAGRPAGSWKAWRTACDRRTRRARRPAGPDRPARTPGSPPSRSPGTARAARPATRAPTPSPAHAEAGRGAGAARGSTPSGRARAGRRTRRRPAARGPRRNRPDARPDVGIHPDRTISERIPAWVRARFGIPSRPDATGSSITRRASAKSPCRAGRTASASRFFSRLESSAPGRATDRMAVRTSSGSSA